MKQLQRIRTFLGHYANARYLRHWKDREQFESWQEKRILRHLQYVRAHSPFYRELWQGLADQQWRSFPLINKQIMMDNFDQLNTAGIKKAEAFELAFQAERTRDFTPTVNGITIGLSSGTSGNRGLFLVSPAEQHAWAGTALAKLLPGSLLTSERIAFFLRADSNLYRSVQGKRIQFSFFDLLDPLEQHIKRLHDYQPTLLVAPASMLRMLADAAACGRLRLPQAPRKIIAVAEVLDVLDRQHIEAAFGQTVHQVYQCTEGFLASTCRYGVLHLNEDIVAIQKQYIDKNAGKFVPVVTDFSRTTQPIIRYRLDDILTEAPPCPCGSVFTALQSIDGRCDDCFYLPDRWRHDKLIPVFPDFIARAIIADPQVTAYHVQQPAPERIIVRLKTAGEDWAAACAAAKAALTALFVRVDCTIPAISIEPLQPYEPNQAYSYRKQRRIERSFTIDAPL
ncbi:F390 synthetase-related protein [Paenibacillus sp. GCM10027626]|uniref:F390 synthetase-related protein n=1 Tax=Paenibacillus sp. GCM10027626 TaxID=3273411 RepID=UPI00362962E9